ncbi:penicillin-insensitive murein endopeptidase [Microbulbifer sp. MCCC 1A16149]|uniref:penicillin-insensitive murein endopeptidase n=1 Tax=Microbulbifer sp. MCCC 1A16149 TaxID=3411322 RepID=UPI003D12FBB7
MKVKHLITIILMTPLVAFAEASTCYGTTSNGRLSHGVKLPSEGKNFVTYSTMARLAGRTYVHSEVRSIIVAAYKDIEAEQPDKVYKYAETGFEEGGEFKPHKTHRNGLSVDFTTPVKDKSGKSVHLPTTPFNKLGYNIEFDANSQYDGLYIDYEAMAAHVVALHKQAKKHGHDLWRVIFDPKLKPNLFKTKYGEYLKTNVQFSKRASWVRHDDHYHVDFDIPCK